MKRIHISKKNFIWLVAGVAAVVFLLLLEGIRSGVGNSLDSQKMADRWSEKKDVVQVSCFFSEEGAVTKEQVVGFGHSLDSKLVEESIVTDSENESARLWMDAYASHGELTLQREKKNVQVKTIGVDGDFFRFHPLELVDGYYFFGTDINQDYCVIDEDIAWQLFGSSHVAGMNVLVDGIPCVIKGVIKREQGHYEEAAGLDKPIAYVSYSFLKEHAGGECYLDYYEIVMPNPVTDYGIGKVRELLTISEEEMEMVDNTHRFSFLSGLELLSQFGIRSMNQKTIIYPYWENVARAKEDVNSLLVFLEIPFLAFCILMILRWLVYYYKHKRWTVHSLYTLIMEKIYDFGARRKQKKDARKKVVAQGGEEKL